MIMAMLNNTAKLNETHWNNQIKNTVKLNAIGLYVQNEKLWNTAKLKYTIKLNATVKLNDIGITKLYAEVKLNETLNWI